MTDFRGKKVAVVGLGKSGLAACRLLRKKGAELFVSEAMENDSLRKEAEALRAEGVFVELGGHTRETIKGKDFVVMSPGVSPQAPPFQWAREEGIPVLSEIELGYLFCKGKIIAVTGSNGKSTTVSLIGKMLEEGGKRAWVCGNIGNPFCDFVEGISPEDWVVLEVSSFQLEECHRFRPHIAVVLNVSPNHLDRHPSLGDYITAKSRIFQSQGEDDYAILNAEDAVVRGFGKNRLSRRRSFSRIGKVEGVYLKHRDLFLREGEKEKKICTLENFRLPGAHNEENALAAVLAAHLAGVFPEAIQKALDTFEGLPHRLEYVTEIRGVRFVNDSKSTTVFSTLRALEACSSPIFLIVGGRGKNEDFHAFKGPLLNKVKRFILIGEAKEKIRAVLTKRQTFFSSTLEEAVRLAFQEAKEEETVLLSPMCASFDMFHDFEERGDFFKRIVGGLAEEHRCVLKE